MKAYDLFFLFLPEKVDFGFGYDPILPPLFPIAIWGPPKQKRFVLSNVFVELLHSNTNLPQLTENQPKQPICVCGPMAVGLRLIKIRPHVKKQK